MEAGEIRFFMTRQILAQLQHLESALLLRWKSLLTKEVKMPFWQELVMYLEIQMVFFRSFDFPHNCGLLSLEKEANIFLGFMLKMWQGLFTLWQPILQNLREKLQILWLQNIRLTISCTKIWEL